MNLSNISVYFEQYPHPITSTSAGWKAEFSLADNGGNYVDLLYAIGRLDSKQHIFSKLEFKEFLHKEFQVPLNMENKDIKTFLEMDVFRRAVYLAAYEHA